MPNRGFRPGLGSPLLLRATTARSARPAARRRLGTSRSVPDAAVARIPRESPETGYVHGTAWFVHQLGARLLLHADGTPALRDALARK